MNTEIHEFQAVILVPDRALTDPGHIRMRSRGGDAGAKHEIHALSQIALYEFEDGDIAVEPVTGPIRMEGEGDLSAGMAVIRKADGSVRILSNSQCDPGDLLSAAHRYCTRWVRLDI